MDSGSEPTRDDIASLLAANDAENTALRTENAILLARLTELEGLVAALRAQIGRDSSNSGKPPSSDSPFVKKPAPKRITYTPSVCAGCGQNLADAEIFGVCRHQVFDIPPPPPRPYVTEHRAVAKTCGGCGTTTEARVPGFASGRVQYGPGVKARAAWLTCAHFLPVRRARRVLNALLGFTVSDGWVAGLRAQAARLLETRFLPHVRALIAAAPVAHADETTARAAGALTYLHVACTQFLTVMHVGDRTGDTIDDDMILRFTVNLAVPFTNNTAELPARSVKVQQRTSGGSWRTLQGLINFAVVRSYLSTATKWGIDTLEAMTRLFTTGPWLPPALTPDLATPCHCSMAG